MKESLDTEKTICLSCGSRKPVNIHLEINRKTKKNSFFGDFRPFFALLSVNSQLVSDDFLIFDKNPMAPDGAVKYLGHRIKEENQERTDNVLLRLSPGAVAVQHVIILMVSRSDSFSEGEKITFTFRNEHSGKEMVTTFENTFNGPSKAVEVGRFDKKEGNWIFEKTFRVYPTGLQEFLDNYTV